MLYGLKGENEQPRTIRMLDVDAISSATVPTINLPASGFACKITVKSDRKKEF